MTAPRLALLALLPILAASCGGTAAGPSPGRAAVAAALQEADARGATFKLSETYTFTGGSIPSGRMLEVRSTGSGRLARGDLLMAYRLSAGSGSSARNLDFTVAIVGPDLFVQPRGAGWRTAPVQTGFEHSGLRLELIRQAALLAPSVTGGGVGLRGGALERHYTFRPSPDQLQQLQETTLTGAALAEFLKNAGGQVDVYVGVPGGHLSRVEVTLDGRDPSDGSRRRAQAGSDFKLGGAASIATPAGAVPTDPAQMFS